MQNAAGTNVVRCERCGRANRVPAAAEGSPRCGNCHAPLPWVVDAGDDTFAEVVEGAGIPVVVDFWASWCAPCRMVTPALEQLAEEFAGRVKLVKVDVDKAPALGERFAVRAVPLLVFMNGRQVVSTHRGAAPAATLRAWVEDGLTKASTAAA